MQDSSLEATITPEHDDSVLLISVDGEVRSDLISGSHTGRRSVLDIRNVTDGVTVVEDWRGRVLSSASSETALSQSAIALRGRYTVNSTDPRTFRLRHRAGESNGRSRIMGGDPGGVLMTIMEVRP